MWPSSEDFAQRRTSLLAFAMNAYRLSGDVDEQRASSDRVLFSHRMMHPYLLAAEAAGSMAILEEGIANAMRMEQDHQEAWVGCRSLSDRWPACNFGEMLRAHIRIDQLEVTPTPRFQIRRASLLLAEGKFAEAKEVLDSALPVLRGLARLPREPAKVAVRSDDDDRIAASGRPNQLVVTDARIHLALRSTAISLFLAQNFDATGDIGLPIPCQGPDDELCEPDVVTAAAFASLTSQLRDGHAFMGAACMALGLFDVAAAEYAEALRLGVGGEMKLYVATSLYGAGCYEQAEAELTKIISDPPPSIIFTAVETQSRAYAWRSRVRQRRGSRSLKAYMAVFIDLYSAITHNSRLVFTVQYLCCLLQCLCIFLTIFATSLAPHVNATTPTA
jgi:tetratricopeptide (TPR) repeat protein